MNTNKEDGMFYLIKLVVEKYLNCKAFSLRVGIQSYFLCKINEKVSFALYSSETKN